MRFVPIIHNLRPTDKGFKEAQKYNELISNKPTAYTLAYALQLQAEWKIKCKTALEEVKKATTKVI